MMDFIDIASLLNFVMLFFLVLTALAVVHVKNLLISTILLSVFSLLMAAQYLVLAAPDVAITEAAVGAGISTILLLMTLFYVGHEEKKTAGNLFVPILIFTIVGSALIFVTFYMPEFGAEFSPAQMHVAPYYITNSPEQIGIPNVVTSILASYRGFDTMGETVVILTAAIAVMLLLGRFDKKDES